MSNEPAKIRLDPQHPYPGLDSFDEDHAAFFRGRVREAAELFTLVELRALTVLYGKSGLGKTSLLQAGLFPRMREAGLVPIRIRLAFGLDEEGERNPPLGAQVRARLREALKRGELDGAEPGDDETLWAYFHWTGFWDASGRPVTPVLVLDQFEEVFTLGRERGDELRALVIELADLVENRVPAALRAEVEEGRAELPPSYHALGAKVLLSLREDFLANLDDFRAVMPSIGAGRYRLRALDGKAALDAVIGPGREVVDDEVAARIVRAAANAAGAALDTIDDVESALLALYCHELNVKRLEACALKIDVALLEGNEEKILDGFYERCVLGMVAAVRSLVEDRLLTPDGRRDLYALRRLEALGVLEADVRLLVARRLLRIESRLNHEYVEIVHDKLTRTIAKKRALRVAAEHDAEVARQQKRVERRRRRWSGGGALVLVGVGLAVLYFYTIQVEQDAKRLLASKADQAKVRIQANKALGEQLTTFAWRAASERRWDDAARMLAPAYSAVIESQKLHDSILSTGDPAPGASASLALLASRFAATTGQVTTLYERTGIEVLRVSADGRWGVELGTDGRTVTVLELQRRAPTRSAFSTSWPADSPGRAPRGATEADAPLNDTFERIDWFSGAIRGLVLSGDGALIFGQGSAGQVVVWSTATGRRLLGFRTRLTRAALSVDRTGGRVLLWDRDEDKAIVVTLDAERTSVVAAVPLVNQDAGDEPSDLGGAWQRTSRGWSWLALVPGGDRVIGVGVDVWRRSDTKDEYVPRAEIQVWDAAKGDKIADEPYDSLLSGAAISGDGRLLATVATDGRIRIWRVTREIRRARTLPQRAAAEPWIAFHEDEPALLVATERALSLWDVETADPTPRFELRLGGKAREVALRSDAREAMVWVDDEVRLYADVRRGHPQAVAALPEVARIQVVEGSVELRIHDGKRQIVTMANDAVRIRSFTDEAPAAPTDRYLWGDSAAARATLSAQLPQTGSVDMVAMDGGRFAVLGDGRAWVLQAPTEAEAGQLDVRAWAKPERAALRAFRVRGDHTAALDGDGLVYFGDLRGAQRPGRPPGQAKAEDAAGSLLALGADGLWAATAGRGPKIHVWDTETGRLAWTADVKQVDGAARSQTLPEIAVTAVAVTSDGPRRPRLVVGDLKGGIRVYRTGAPNKKKVAWSSIAAATTENPHRDAVRVIEIESNARFAAGAADGTVALWSLDAEGKSLRAVEAPSRHEGAVQSLAFADDGKALVSGGADRIARVWPTAGSVAGCAMREHGDSVIAIAAEPGAGNHRVISVDDSGTALLWSTRDCKPVRRFGGVAYAGFLAGKPPRLVTVRRSGRVEIWAGESDGSAQRSGPQGTALFGTFVGPSELVTGDDEGALFDWTTDLRDPIPVELAGGLRGVPLIARAGDRIVAVTPDGLLRAWVGPSDDVTEVAFVPSDPGWSVRAAALSPDGAQLFLLDEGPDAKLRGRSLEWGNWSWHQTESRPVELAKGAGCDATSELSSDRVFASATTDRGAMVLVADGAGCVRIWGDDGKLRLDAGRTSVSVDPARRTIAAALGPTGDRLFLGSLDGTVSVWSIEPSVRAISRELSLRAISRERRHTGRIRAIAFHPQDDFAVTAGDDGLAWLWDVGGGRPLVRLGAHPGPILWAAFAPGGAEVVTGGADGWIRAWRTQTSTAAPSVVLDTLHAWLPELLEGRAGQ